MHLMKKKSTGKNKPNWASKHTKINELLYICECIFKYIEMWMVGSAVVRDHSMPNYTFVLHTCIWLFLDNKDTSI